jgi:hypothetical protein
MLRDLLPAAQMEDEICVQHWAKLQLPTGQNCYSAWKEMQKPIEKRRTARNVKVCSISLHVFLPYLKHIQILLDDQMRLGEVQFFIPWTHEGCETPLMLVSLYSTPEPRLLKASHNTLWSCEYQGDTALQFIKAKTIQSVVAMIPHTPIIEGVGIWTGRPLHAGLRLRCTILSNYFTPRLDTNKGDRDTGIASPP